MQERQSDAYVPQTSDVDTPDSPAVRAVPGVLPAVLRPPTFDPWPDTSVHVEWGRTGAALAAARGDVVVVVDVLSFSTTLSIAASRDFTCLIYSGAEIESLGGPAIAAIRLGARPLSRRRKVGQGQVSLSPASLLEAEPGQRVIFTSLNGAAVVSAASKAPAVLIGSPRNATACATRATDLMTAVRAGRVTVVACGEQWSSVEAAAEGARPAIEDWLGAGAVCARMADLGYSLSAEARLAASAWAHPSALDDVADCVSARELRAAGFAADVELALQVDADSKVPVRMAGEQTGRVFLGG
ncbi:2-phosphosulfolactate phosphatase [Actinospica sp.]|jgi:2-phosphosulfolactate phosphatase|uniref:2-phosphosulfolactate phosphatase n=1 Tax=Actinospica sp. TaxID=1872142 RepID=UPI002D16249D|nr:2-phosphosulfolactate phosphatase [Actinospica sp.]HWG24615.1 2-phosphosulfolactate phosphatase [Actinospica sp.]